MPPTFCETHTSPQTRYHLAVLSTLHLSNFHTRHKDSPSPQSSSRLSSLSNLPLPFNISYTPLLFQPLNHLLFTFVYHLTPLSYPNMADAGGMKNNNFLQSVPKLESGEGWLRLRNDMEDYITTVDFGTMSRTLTFKLCPRGKMKPPLSNEITQRLLLL